jgi:hypothetical protein
VVRVSDIGVVWGIAARAKQIKNAQAMRTSITVSAGDNMNLNSIFHSFPFNQLFNYLDTRIFSHYFISTTE